MTLSEAQAEYDRLLHKRSTPTELATGLKELIDRTNKLNIAYYNLCDNDEKEGDIFP